MRLGEKLIEIFDNDNNAIAAHARLSGIHKTATLQAHYPPEKTAVARFEIRHARTAAEIIGPHTVQLIEALIAGDHPFRHLRRIQGFLRMSPRYSKESLEYAARQAVQFQRLRLSYLRQCADYFTNGGIKSQSKSGVAPERQSHEIHLA